MIVVAMGLITESLLIPAFGGELPPHQQAIFALGTLAMAALAAGANVINDYFDVAEDRVNRPDRTFVGRVITRRQTLALNYTLTGIAVLSSLALQQLQRALCPPSGLSSWAFFFGAIPLGSNGASCAATSSSLCPWGNCHCGAWRCWNPVPSTGGWNI